MRTAAYDMYAQSMHESSAHWATMQQEFPNIQVRSFSPEIMTSLRKANDELLQETATADPFSAKVLKSQQDYLKKIRVWTEMSDKAYLDTTKAN